MDVIDYKAAGFWFSVGQWAFNVIVALYLFTSRKHAATNSRVDNLVERVETTEKDMIGIKADLEHMPDHDEITQLRKEITGLIQKIGEATGRLDGLNRAVDLINEFLINQGRR